MTLRGPGPPHARLAVLVLLGLVASLAPARADKLPVPSDVAAADALAATPASRSRDQALARWAGQARLGEILYLLRRDPAELGGVEATLVRQALQRASKRRTALRRQLTERMEMAGRRGNSRPAGEGPERVRASVFRVAALLPDSGSYGDFGRAVLVGLEAGLRRAETSGGLPIELEAHPTGDDRPARAATALDKAAARSAVLVGELLSGPTYTIASATRYLGIPLISPTATDEQIGTIGRGIYQIGPSGYRRGRALAQAVLDRPGLRLGILVTSRTDGERFARAFEAEALARGVQPAWRAAVAEGDPDLRRRVREIRAKRLDLLFFDGDARDAETLVRQLAAERVSVRLCGGAGFDPERHHAAARPLLNGARYVSEDWDLPENLRPELDGVARAHGEEKANRLHVRGYLAGRLIAIGVATGALCSEELIAGFDALVGRESGESGGFIAWQPGLAMLPVYTVTGGRAIP